MGCRRVPVVTLPALGLVSKGTEGTRLQPQVLPLLAPAHQYESEHSMWRPAFKRRQSQAEDTCSGRWGWFLGHREGQDVQPQPGSLTSHLSYEGEETELPFPGIPRDTSKSTSEEELSSLQVGWKLPGFWERGNPTGSRAALSPESLAERNGCSKTTP